MTHPLTDKEALSLFSFERLMDKSQPITVEDAMRDAADWQLEQVIKFLETNKNLSIETALRFIRPAMRPQENN